MKDEPTISAMAARAVVFAAAARGASPPDLCTTVGLDPAALADIGWQIDLPGGSASAATIVSGSTFSQSAVLAALTAVAVPEPASASLLLIAVGLAGMKRCRRVALRPSTRLVA